MKYFIIFIFFDLFGVSSCDNSEKTTGPYNCITSSLNQDLIYNDLINDIPNYVITGLVERPDENGALGRNKDGYFHVRFQLNMTKLTDYAIKFQNQEALSEYLKALNYSFAQQKPTGNFECIPPDYISQKPNYQPTSEADLASGTAFFAYSLGLSLNSLSKSHWFTNSPSTANLRNEINLLNPNIGIMLDYLKSTVGLLNVVDADAPNRLLYNAIAFYTLGIYLNDQDAINIGIAFANNALLQRNETEGYFIESDGWDSSYNGVAIKLCFELFTLIQSNSEQSLKNKLELIVSCATDWQKSRIHSTGEISTDGNTRVFDGGEEFLGNEKEVDVVKTIKAFFYMQTLSNKNEYELLARSIIEHYE